MTIQINNLTETQIKIRTMTRTIIKVKKYKNLRTLYHQKT